MFFCVVSGQFQSTPSAWRETGGDIETKAENTAFQSTPSAWRETTCTETLGRSIRISIHSLRMEGDAPSYPALVAFDLFQSTPSAWRETCCGWEGIAYTGHFNPLPPHGGRQFKTDLFTFSIQFQSTPSAWRETFGSSGKYVPGKISIHSLRMEGDVDTLEQGSIDLVISIHSLRMEGDKELMP